MDYLQVFNTKFLDFLKDLSSVFPEDKDFKVAQTSVKLILMGDKAIVSTIFKEKVVIPYSAKIMETDETFFLSKSYDNEFDTNSAVGIVEKIKEYWINLSVENKTTVWKYLKLLVVLCQKI